MQSQLHATRCNIQATDQDAPVSLNNSRAGDTLAPVQPLGAGGSGDEHLQQTLQDGVPAEGCKLHCIPAHLRGRAQREHPERWMGGHLHAPKPEIVFFSPMYAPAMARRDFPEQPVLQAVMARFMHGLV